MGELDKLGYIEKKFGYKFKAKDILERAVRHSSEIRKRGAASDFERSELLGDKILSMVLADILYRKYPDDDEGNLSIRLAYLSGKGFMSVLFKDLGLESALIQHNDCRTQAVAADYMEAIIGAVFLDSDYQTVRDIVGKIWMDGINDSLHRDSKSVLQEVLQAKSDTPVYTLINTSGPQNNLNFSIEVSSKVYKLSAVGTGRSKKDAEQDAAKKLLEKLEL